MRIAALLLVTLLVPVAAVELAAQKAEPEEPTTGAGQEAPGGPTRLPKGLKIDAPVMTETP